MLSIGSKDFAHTERSDSVNQMSNIINRNEPTFYSALKSHIYIYIYSLTIVVLILSIVIAIDTIPHEVNEAMIRTDVHSSRRAFSY